MFPYSSARVTLGTTTSARSAPLFKELGWIPFIEELRLAKVQNRECPRPYINNLLRTNSECHQRTTRYSISNSKGMRVLKGKSKEAGTIFLCESSRKLE